MWMFKQLQALGQEGVRTMEAMGRAAFAVAFL